jgi:hydroxymethylpyrimidine pyrophosphatase-like HAD family hydrolase
MFGPNPAGETPATLPPMPPRFDAVVCDIDGCLCPETTEALDGPRLERVAEHNRAAQSRRDRPVVTVCSGRPEPFVEAMCRLITNRTLPCVAENGVWLWHPADNRYDMDPRISSEHLRAVQEARAWVTEHLGPRGVVMQPGKSASISLYHPDTAFLRSLEPVVREAFTGHGWPFRFSMTWFYINCDLEIVSKATGLDRVMAAAGLARERIAGIGDTMGDLAIRERVAFFACPANADERVKAHADYVSPHAEVEGVLDILGRLARLGAPA